MLLIASFVYASKAYSLSSADVFAFACFFLGATACLSLSVMCHAMINHSPSINKFWNQLDYVGIVALITGSFVPSVYYGFRCEPALQRLYWSMASLEHNNE